MTKSITIPVSDSVGTVSGDMIIPESMAFLYVFAHGAGAGMNHPFMMGLATELSRFNIGSLRYNFPFMEKRGKRPDPPTIAEKTVGKAIGMARDLYPGVPLLAGGKSFGGRMTSQLLSKSPIEAVKGIVFVGFPLHAPGNPSIIRAEHFGNVSIPMLFLQGTRDALAKIDLMEQVTANLTDATLRKLEGADHSFKAGKHDLIPSLAEVINTWAREHCSS